MSNISSQISYLLRIAIDINKKIGGSKAYQAQKKAKDKFSVLKDQISKKIFMIRSAMERKPLSKDFSAWTTDQQQELKQKLHEINSCIIRIKQSVQQQKSNQAAKQLKFQIIQKLQEQYKSYESLLNQNSLDDTERSSLNPNKKFQTLTQMRTQLLGEQTQGTVYGSKKGERRNLGQKATEIQMQKMQQWNKEQEQIDDHVDVIIEKTLNLKSSINQAGKLVNEIDVKVKQLTTNVQNLTDDLTKSNKKLKGIVEKFRQPHKFCVDIILTIILIGLIVGIIKVSSS